MTLPNQADARITELEAAIALARAALDKVKTEHPAITADGPTQPQSGGEAGASAPTA